MSLALNGQLSGAYSANRLCAVLCSFDSFISHARPEIVISTKAEPSFAYLWGRGEKGPEGAEH